MHIWRNFRTRLRAIDWRRRAVKDALVISALALVTFVVTVWFDLFDNFLRFADAHSEYELHELILVFCVMGVAMIVFCFRRLKELSQQIKARRQAESDLKTQAQLMQAAIGNMIQGLCMFDAQNRLLVWNERYRAMYNIDPLRIWRGATIRDLLDARIAAGTFPLDPARYDGELRAALKEGKTFTLNIELADGRVIAVVNQPIKGGGWVATHEDITERKRAERELDRTRTFLDTIIDNVPSNIVVKELPSLRYLLVNRAGEKHFGLPREKMIGKTTAEIFPKGTADLIHQHDLELLKSGRETFSDEHAIISPDGNTHIVTTTRLPVMGDDGKPQYMIAVIDDLTQRKRDEARIAHMAHYDPLTELPNRTAFNECIAATLDLAAAAGESFGLLSIDLDRFKTVNDVFGHSVGDRLLREVASRLESVCQGAFLARVGGDEFTVITPTGPQPATAEALAEKLCAALDTDIDIDGAPLRVGLTVGVAIFPQDGADAATLVANADAALFRAKSEARGSIRFFELAMDRQLREKRVLQQDLRTAIVRDEIELHYQPQAHIDGEVTGFEALVRWHHPRQRPGLARHLHSARRGERDHRRARRMDSAHRLPRGGVLAAAAAHRHQPVAGAVPARRSAEAGAPGAAGNRSGAGAPRARDHRGRADRRFQPRGCDPAPAESSRRAHRHGRFRHRLFVAVLFAVVPVRQDQDRPVLHRQSRPQPAGRRHRARGDRARARARSAGGGGRRGDRRTAQVPRRRILQRDPGLFHRPAETDRGLCGVGRPSVCAHRSKRSRPPAERLGWR